MASFGNEWDYYLHAYRLDQGLSRGGNAEARKLLRPGFPLAHNNKSNFARGYGLLSFTILTGWLSDWFNKDCADQILDNAIADVIEATEKRGLPETTRDILNATSRIDINTIIKAVVLGYAETATNLDAVENGDNSVNFDFDNQWSLATAKLYTARPYKADSQAANGDFAAALNLYTIARGLAAKPEIPEVNKGSLDVDYADALFFAGDTNLTPDDPANADKIRKAIRKAQRAIRHNRTDPKRHRWNWTLGWAYYELARFEDPINNCLKALAILHKNRAPHDLIRKNIMAAYVGADMASAAKPLAEEFKLHNPGYTVAVENRWPYRSDAQRQRWKDDLKGAGLPDEP